MCKDHQTERWEMCLRSRLSQNLPETPEDAFYVPEPHLHTGAGTPCLVSQLWPGGVIALPP